MFPRNVPSLEPLSVEIANGFNILPQLLDVPELERAVMEHQEGAKEKLQSVRSQIVEQILLASFQTTAINAEINCEVERAQQLAAHLRQHNEDRAQVLTIIGLVVGGVLSICRVLAGGTTTFVRLSGVDGRRVHGGKLSRTSSARRVA